MHQCALRKHALSERVSHEKRGEGLLAKQHDQGGPIHASRIAKSHFFQRESKYTVLSEQGTIVRGFSERSRKPNLVRKISGRSELTVWSLDLINGASILHANDAIDKDPEPLRMLCPQVVRGTQAFLFHVHGQNISNLL